MSQGTATSYTVQCCVSDVKAFKAMLVCLDKFGKDLFLEANDREVRSPASPRPLMPTRHVSANHAGDVAHPEHGSISICRLLTEEGVFSRVPHQPWSEFVSEDDSKECGIHLPLHQQHQPRLASARVL